MYNQLLPTRSTKSQPVAHTKHIKGHPTLQKPNRRCTCSEFPKEENLSRRLKGGRTGTDTPGHNPASDLVLPLVMHPPDVSNPTSNTSHHLLTLSDFEIKNPQIVFLPNREKPRKESETRKNPSTRVTHQLWQPKYHPLQGSVLHMKI